MSRESNDNACALEAHSRSRSRSSGERTGERASEDKDGATTTTTTTTTTTSSEGNDAESRENDHIANEMERTHGVARDRERCERVLAYVRLAGRGHWRGLERAGNARASAEANDEKNVEGMRRTWNAFGDDAMAMRAALYKFRARVARVRMQPRRMRKGRKSDDESEVWARNGRQRDRAYDDELRALTAVLEHAPYAHDALDDTWGARKGWTGERSTMSRAGVIRVGDAHQASVAPSVADSKDFVRGSLSKRETMYLGTKIYPNDKMTENARPSEVEQATRADDRAFAPTRMTTLPTTRISAPPAPDSPLSETMKYASVSSGDEGERASAIDEGEVVEVVAARTPVVAPEIIATARARLEAELEHFGVAPSAIGLDTIGTDACAMGWTTEERQIFAEHASKHSDDLYPLRKALPKKSMRDVVSYYYNVWQTNSANDGRVDVAGSEEPTPRVRVKKPAATKIPPEVIQKEKDVKSLTGFLDWLRATGMNPKRAIKNAYRAPTSVRIKTHIMSRFRDVINAEVASPALDEYLEDLYKRKAETVFARVNGVEKRARLEHQQQNAKAEEENKDENHETYAKEKIGTGEEARVNRDRECVKKAHGVDNKDTNGNSVSFVSKSLKPIANGNEHSKPGEGEMTKKMKKENVRTYVL